MVSSPKARWLGLPTYLVELWSPAPLLDTRGPPWDLWALALALPEG